MNHEYGEDKRPCCIVHAKEVFVGVCPLCLNERLLVLFAQQELLEKQQQKHQRKQSNVWRSRRGESGEGNNVDSKRKRILIRFTKLFGFGSNVLHCWKSSKHDGSPEVQEVCTSLEDSFISIKFEGNGAASWDKGKMSKIPVEQRKDPQTNKANTTAIANNPKPRALVRWCKKIVQLLMLMRWRRPSNKNKTNVLKLMRWRRSKKNKTNIESQMRRVKSRISWLRRRRKRTSMPTQHRTAY